MSRSAGGTSVKAKTEFTGPWLNRRSQAQAAISGCWEGEWQEYRPILRSDSSGPPASVAAPYSTSVIVMIIGAPTAPRGRIVSRRRIISWSGWVVAVAVVAVWVRIIVGV